MSIVKLVIRVVVIVDLLFHLKDDNWLLCGFLFICNFKCYVAENYRYYRELFEPSASSGFF